MTPKLENANRRRDQVQRLIQAGRPLALPQVDLKALLPNRWGAPHPEHLLAHRLDESGRKAIRERRQARKTASAFP